MHVIMMRSRGVKIPALDTDPESDCQLFGNFGSGFGSRTKQNCKIYRSVIILGLDPDPELDFQPFGSS